LYIWMEENQKKSFSWLHFCLSFVSQYLPNLKTMVLRNSKNLIKLPNFEEVPNLKKLYLSGCVNLLQLDPSIGLLTKLVSGCSKMSNHPKHLKKLDSSESVLHSQSMSDRNLAIVPKPIEVVKYRSHEDCF